MIFDISDYNFKNIFNDKNFFLPIRWDGNDFALTLQQLFARYLEKVNSFNLRENINQGLSKNNIKKLDSICNSIVRSVRKYLNGFPSEAFICFKSVMDELIKIPLKTYYKSTYEYFERGSYDDPLKLFRAVNVTDNIPYNRERVFHTPFNLRSKISTCRYSIAGYPSLYLGTSLELCCEEIRYNHHDKLGLAARFELERNFHRNNTEISVIELAIKPQDFFGEENEDNFNSRKISRGLLYQNEIREAYLVWYPLIAACSFMRVNKSDPFAAEYIIPQLLMQWVRSKLRSHSKCNYNSLIGIRYFSCASERCSDMGFNYVFPVNCDNVKGDERYCKVLSQAFRLTKPYFIHEYSNILDCEHAMLMDNNLDRIR